MGERVEKNDKMLKDIYIWSREKADELLRRKQHIEMKILYLLPVVSIIMGFVTVNLKEAEKLTKELKILVKMFNGVSYILLIISMFFLIAGLEDVLLKKKWIRCIYNYEYGKQIELMNGIIDTPFPKKMLDGYTLQRSENKTTNDIYRTMIDNLQKVCKNIELVSTAKNMCLVYGVKFNLYAILIILFKSIIVVNWG